MAEIKEVKETKENKKIVDSGKEDSLISKLEALIKKGANMFFSEVSNIALELSDGSMIFIDSEDGDLVGKTAWIADDEGNRTEEKTPGGTYNLADGRAVIVDADGVVTAVEEATDKMDDDDEEKQALKDRVEELEAQLAQNVQETESITNEKEVLVNEQEESKSLIKEFIDEMKTLKEEVSNISKRTVGGDFKTPKKAYVKPTDKSVNKEVVTGSQDPLSGWATKIALQQGIKVKNLN